MYVTPDLTKKVEWKRLTLGDALGHHPMSKVGFEAMEVYSCWKGMYSQNKNNIILLTVCCG